MHNNLVTIREKAAPIFKRYGIIKAAVFGSYARGEEKSNSDIDLLVQFRKVPGLINYIRIENELAKVLGKEVDLATEHSLHRLIKPQVLQELQTIYEE